MPRDLPCIQTEIPKAKSIPVPSCAADLLTPTIKLILGCLFPLAIAQRRSFLKRSAISKLPSADILYLVDRIYGYRVESLFRGERLPRSLAFECSLVMELFRVATGLPKD